MTLIQRKRRLLRQLRAILPQLTNRRNDGLCFHLEGCRTLEQEGRRFNNSNLMLIFLFEDYFDAHGSVYRGPFWMGNAALEDRDLFKRQRGNPLQNFRRCCTQRIIALRLFIEIVREMSPRKLRKARVL